MGNRRIGPVNDDDRTLLAFIESYIDEHGYAPTYAEMISNSSNGYNNWSLSRALNRLRHSGYIATDHPGSPRAMRLDKKVGA